MNRLEYIRTIVDQELSVIQKQDTKKYAYIHLYGVCQCAAYLAIKRNLNIELAGISAILHDISTYTENCPHKQHAQRSAVYANKLLINTNLFNEEEITIITNAIADHSNKETYTNNLYNELLKDSDLLQEYLYDPSNMTPSTRLVNLLKNL